MRVVALHAVSRKKSFSSFSLRIQTSFNLVYPYTPDLCNSFPRETKKFGEAASFSFVYQTQANIKPSVLKIMVKKNVEKLSNLFNIKT
jgi:hypothetical protein